MNKSGSVNVGSLWLLQWVVVDKEMVPVLLR